MNGTPWTKEQSDFAYRRRQEGATCVQIALEVDRSVLSIEAHLQRRRNAKAKFWTSEADRIVLNDPPRDVAAKLAALGLIKSERAIRRRKQELRQSERIVDGATVAAKRAEDRFCRAMEAAGYQKTGPVTTPGTKAARLMFASEMPLTRSPFADI